MVDLRENPRAIHMMQTIRGGLGVLPANFQGGWD